MYLLDAKQIKDWDNATLMEQSITSLELMERAGQALAREMVKEIPYPDTPVYILCGRGNNGGDGLVIGRHLRNQFYNVTILEVSIGSSAESVEYATMRKKIMDLGNVPINSFSADSTINLKKDGVLIDALFGTGLNRPPEGETAEVIHYVNSLGLKVLSVDLPSGMQIGLQPSNLAIKAQKVYTIQSPKLPFYLEESQKWMDTFCIVDIGLTKSFRPSTPFHTIDHDFIHSFINVRQKVSHKGNYGHAAIVAGDRDTAGAAVLASGAASRSGAGWVTLYSRSEVNNLALVAHPEVMTKSLELLPETTSFSKYDSVGIGCGLSLRPTSLKWLSKIIEGCPKNLILDADALNMLATNTRLLKTLPKECILTPHPGEFDRMFGVHKSSSSRIQTQVEQSKALGCYIVLKTSITSISTPEGSLYFNTTGNPGMAKAGSGDVLLGLMTGLVARWQNPLHGACLAVYLHGLAGDYAAEQQGEEAMKASDIIQHLPHAFKTTFEKLVNAR